MCKTEGDGGENVVFASPSEAQKVLERWVDRELGEPLSQIDLDQEVVPAESRSGRGDACVVEGPRCTSGVESSDRSIKHWARLPMINILGAVSSADGGDELWASCCWGDSTAVQEEAYVIVDFLLGFKGARIVCSLNWGWEGDERRAPTGVQR